MQARLPGRTLFNGDRYIISLEPWNHDYFTIGPCVFQSANRTPWLLGETKLALWTASKSLASAVTARADLAEVVVGGARGERRSMAGRHVTGRTDAVRINPPE